MTYDQRPYRGARDDRGPQTNGTIDPKLRELLGFLRDTCREVAVRIDQYLGSDRGSARGYAERSDRGERSDRNDRGYTSGRYSDAPRAPRASGGDSAPVHDGLEKLREEARRVSDEAPDMDPAKLRLLIEAITAETRAFQGRADDAEDQDLAAKILRTLTAVVSEHRPGHVYGLARHHTAEWSEVARRARDDIASGNLHRARPDEGGPRSVRDDDSDIG